MTLAGAGTVVVVTQLEERRNVEDGCRRRRLWIDDCLHGREASRWKEAKKGLSRKKMLSGNQEQEKANYTFKSNLYVILVVCKTYSVQRGLCARDPVLLHSFVVPCRRPHSVWRGAGMCDENTNTSC